MLLTGLQRVKDIDTLQRVKNTNTLTDQFIGNTLGLMHFGVIRCLILVSQIPVSNIYLLSDGNANNIII
jgi:hypothetical protein